MFKNNRLFIYLIPGAFVLLFVGNIAESILEQSDVVITGKAKKIPALRVKK